MLVYSPAYVMAQANPSNYTQLADRLSTSLESNQGNFLQPSEAEHLIHKLFSGKKEEVLSYLNASNTLNSHDIEIFSKYFEAIDSNQNTSENGLSWLTNCANTSFDNIASMTYAYRCSVLSAYVFFMKDNLYQAKKNGSKAVKIISSPNLVPNDPYIQLHAYDVLFSLFTFDSNTGAAVRSANTIIDLVNEYNLQIDYISFLNNLIVNASNEGDLEGMFQLSELLVARANDYDGEDLAFLYHSATEASLNSNHLRKAIKYSDLAYSNSSDEFIRIASRVHKARAQTSLKEFTAADYTLKILETEFREADGLIEYFDSDISAIKALIQNDQGNFETAFDLYKAWSDQEIMTLKGKLLARNRSASMNLERSEKELAGKLKEVELESKLANQRLRLQQLLLIVLVGLVLIGTTFLLFLSSYSRKLKKTNKQLQISMKAAKAASLAKERFIGMLGHELRTPLNPIIALSDVLKQRITEPDNRRLISVILSSGNRLHNTLENMIIMTAEKQLFDVDITRLNINDLFNEVIEEFAEISKSKNLKISVTASHNWVPYRLTSKHHLSLIAKNLIGNAVKFSESGTVEICLSFCPDFTGWRLQVKDHGVGFDIKQMDTLFKPFEQDDNSLTRAYEGAGMGLAVVKRYVDLLQAKIDVWSQKDVGTIITIDFPDIDERGHLIPQKSLAEQAA